MLYGLGGRVFSINHSYYTLSGFTIDGQQNIARTAYPAVSSLSQIRTFKDSVQDRAVNSKLVYVGASTTQFDIVGTTISDMFLNGSGGECVRFRDRAANSLIDNSTIQWCGMLGQGDDVDQYKYHNAEGVYVGTSPKSTDQPLYANDTSNNIVVRNSTINTYGSECFEVKENAHHNRMENSKCGWNDEPSTFQGSNVEFRGDHNTVLGSTLSNSRSWNMKLASDSSTYDKGGNTAQGTSFSGAATYGIINRQTGSGPFCGDTFTGSVSDPSGNSVGTPTATCAGSTAPTVTARTPAAGATGVAATTTVTATFSEAVQGVSGTTFTLKAGSTAVGAQSVLQRRPAGSPTLTPSAPLAANTQYTATLTGGASAIKGATGTPLATVSWTFTTAAPAAPADTTAPTVTAQSPAANATGVAVTATVTATFSEAVSGVTGLDRPRSRLKNATSTASPVAATVTYDATSRVATLKPSAALAVNTAVHGHPDRRCVRHPGRGQQPAGDRVLDVHHRGRPGGHHRADADHAVPELELHLGQPHGEHHGHLQRARQRCQRHHVRPEDRQRHQRLRHRSDRDPQRHHQPVDPQPELDPRIEDDLPGHRHRRNRCDPGCRGQSADHRQLDLHHRAVTENEAAP